MALKDVGPHVNNNARGLLPIVEVDEAAHGLMDHEAAEFFLVAARCGCFMQAARALSVKPTVLRRKISQLSVRYGRPLFEHQGNTLVLSQDGRHLHGKLLECRALLAPPVPLDDDQPLMRLAVADSLLHDILSRGLLSFLRQHANARLELLRLDNDPTQEPVLADVIVWVAGKQETPPQLMFPVSEQVCLAELEYIPHIGNRYSRSVSRPRNLCELQDYMLVNLHSYAKVSSLQPWNDVINQRHSGVTQVNAYELMCQMIQWSACIGLLPHYVSMLDKTMQPLPGLFDQRMDMQVWMAVHSDEAHREEVQRLVALIHGAFDEHREWF